MHPSVLDVWAFSILVALHGEKGKKYPITRGNISNIDIFPRVIGIFWGIIAL